MRNLKSLAFLFAILLTTILNCFSQTKTITTSKKGCATQTGWEWITNDMSVGHDHNVIVNDVSHRAFAWFDIPSDIRDGVITSATLTVDVKDISEWNEWLDYIYLYTVNQTWYTFRNSYDFGTGVYVWQYNELSGDDFIDRKGKNSKLVFSIDPDFLKDKSEQGFALRASPETPSDFWGKKTNYIILNNPTLTIEYTQVTLSSITINGATSVNENSTASYTCTANYSDGSTQNVTNSVTWSENSNYATINSSGVLTTSSVSSDQSCTISASYGGKSDTYNITIKNVAPTLNSITISGATSVNENSSVSYTCTANYSDGSSQNVTNSTNWSENSSYATVNSSGVLTTSSVNSNQSCTISASYGGKSDTHNVTIKNVAATLNSITISGENSVNENISASYTCTANYSDGSTQNVTNSVTWSENSSYATINSSGVLTTSSVSSDQSCTISASYGGKLDTHNVTIKNVAATLNSITISGATSVNESSSSSYTCTANYSDGSTQNVTNSVTWSENSSYATINSSGVLTTSSVSSDQSCTISASYDGKSDTHSITIKNITATLNSITISGTTSVNENSSASYTCVANYSDGSTLYITNSTSWSENSSYATINSNGVLTTSSVNSDQPCTITASYGSKSDTHSIIIKDQSGNSDELIWEDGFEDYTSGTFPRNWVADANATNSSKNYTDSRTQKDGTNSLKLFGTLGGCWGALAYRSLSVSPPYYISIDVKNGTEQLSGCHPYRASIALRKGTSWSNPSRSLVDFKNDGKIYANGGDLLASYATNTWINVIIKYELPSSNQVKTTFWINNNLIDEYYSSTIAEENGFDNLQLAVQEGTAWFDNIKIYKSLSIPTGFNSYVYENKIKIYPNPVKEQITISIDDPNLINSNVKIINSLGSILSVHQLDSYETKINTSRLFSSFYIIQIQNGSFIYNKKIIK